MADTESGGGSTGGAPEQQTQQIKVVQKQVIGKSHKDYI